LAGGRIGFSVLRSYSLNFLAGTSGRFSDGKKKECARIFKTASFLPTSRPSIVGPANRTFSKWSDLYSEARTVFEEGRDKDLITLEE